MKMPFWSLTISVLFCGRVGFAGAATIPRGVLGAGQAHPQAGGSPPHRSMRVMHDIIQHNDGSNWVTLSQTYMVGTPVWPIVAGKAEIYYSANFSQGSDVDPNTIGTMTMDGVPTETYDATPTCQYGPYTERLSYQDFVFNRQGNTIMSTVGLNKSTNAMLWAFVSADGVEGACHTLVGGTDGASGYFPMALGPNDTIWAVGSQYVWRFSKNGDAKPIIKLQASFNLKPIIEGPDGVMWAIQNASNLLRIDPNNGKVLNTYKAPSNCTGALSLAVIGRLVWGLAGNCIYSVTRDGTFTTYQVDPGGASQYGGANHGLTQGPDGKPWFVTQLNKGNQEVLGTLDPSNGNVTLYPLPVQAPPQNVTVGPDGNLWMTVSPFSGYGDILVYIPNPLTVTPASVTLPKVGAKQQITASENGTTNWTATSQNTSIATVSKTKTAGVFTVKATGVGSTSVTVSDKVGNSVLVPVTVQ